MIKAPFILLRRRSFTMASTTPKVLSPDMANFLKAMQHVYRFPAAPADGASEVAWTPPPAAAGHRGRYLWTGRDESEDVLESTVLTSLPSKMPSASSTS
jgi:hypothetical protein